MKLIDFDKKKISKEEVVQDFWRSVYVQSNTVTEEGCAEICTLPYVSNKGADQQCIWAVKTVLFFYYDMHICFTFYLYVGRFVF